MKSRSFVAAYSAVTLACICLFPMLLRAEVLYPSPVPAFPPADMAGQRMAQTLQGRLAGQQVQLTLLYQARNYRPLWFGPNGISSDGRQALAIVAAADRDALPVARYAVPSPPDARASDAGKADFDIALTGALLRYAADMRWGAWRPEQLFDDAEMAREPDDLAGGLARAADHGNAAAYLQGLAPPSREYGQLRDALTRDRDLAAGGDVSAAARAQRIAVNMERLRWFPHAPGAQYILVNVPDASLVLMESGQPVLISKVVVGARDKTTPILSTEAVSVTINPAWHVPASIVRRELRPKGGGYLAAKNMYVRDGQVIQRPGPGNALGVVKFEMPNDFNVYLHDTPTKKAFLSEDRALSHGCVRVQKIRSLAAHALGLREEELQHLIARGRTDGRRLAAPIPVYIQYGTAVPRGDGQIVFLDDVYGRDARMIRAMFPSQAPLLVAGR